MYHMETPGTVEKACPRCGRRLTSVLKSCPACGAHNPYVASSIQRVIGFTLIAALLGVLVWLLLMPASPVARI